MSGARERLPITLRRELKELAWLTSVVTLLSIAAVGAAAVLAITLRV